MRRTSIVLILLAVASQCARGAQPVNLRSEYLTDPLGLDSPRPRLSWVIESDLRGERQTAYQVLVSTRPELLESGHPDLWDSGKVASDRSIQVEYEGKPLASRTRCWWRVRLWDKNGSPSPWSKTALWSMGLLRPGDWRGQWVGAGELGTADANPAVLLRKDISLKGKPVRATAYISGLGYYELYINGKRISDHVLDPGFTDYNRRVLYITYDVTAEIGAGANAMGVILGNGWYHSPTPDLFSFEKAPWKSWPKMILNLDLEYPDGSHETVASDRGWKWSTGPITFNSIRSGETYDARQERPGWDRPGYDDRDWKPAIAADAPAGRLSAQAMPPMRVTETVRPVKLTEPKPGVYLFDLGVNLTGWARLETRGKPGEKISLDFNELLLPDGTLDLKNSHSHTYGRYQTGELILGGDGHGVFEPRFTYHGFRYVQITGASQPPKLDDLSGRGVHTDWSTAGEFSCSNSKINLLQKAVLRTLSNACHSIPGEEATREKMGWTQDGLNTMEPAIYNYDAATVYSKYLQDMIDAQEANGHVPCIVPTDGWCKTAAGGAPPEYSDPWWGGTMPYVAWKLYEYYGDRRVLEQAYDPMRRWADYMTGTAKDHVVDWWLGDWQEAGASGRPKRTPIPETSTAGYYYCVKAVADAARLLEKQSDAEKYYALASQIKESYNRHFYHSETGEYAKDSQTSMALTLWLGLEPDGERRKILERLVTNIHQWRDHTSTGFVGVMPEVFGLVDWGYPDLAYKIVTQEDYPGWWQMIADGNSTLGEALDKLDGSRAHPFGSAIGAWYFRSLAGIRPDLSKPGFKHIVLKPIVVGDLKFAEASYNSMHGRIAVNWRRDGDKLQLEATIPANTTATVYVPSRDSKSVTPPEGVQFLRREGGASVFEAGSGNYRFTSVLPGE
jgi:alpha-L-rhamnosidase